MNSRGHHRVAARVLEARGAGPDGWWAGAAGCRASGGARVPARTPVRGCGASPAPRRATAGSRSSAGPGAWWALPSRPREPSLLAAWASVGFRPP
jgi:hypothetical protein